MKFLKQSWAQVWAMLDRMSFAEKGLIVALAVIALLVVGGLLYVAASPQRVAIPFGGEASAATALLQRNGIDAATDNGKLMVPYDKQHQAISILADHDRIDGNATEAFAKLVEANPWETNAQMRSKYTVALQAYLSKVVNRMKGVRSASVMLAMPEQKGFGRTTVKPSASVMVDIRGRDNIRKEMVQAIASLVSGAVADMRPQDVEVIDSNGRSYGVDDPEDELPSVALELVRNEERYHQKKITDLLMIRGVIVAVSVDMDPVRQERDEKTTYMTIEPLLRESSKEITTTDTQRGGEPGVRSNDGLTIAGSGGTGRTHTETTSENSFGPKLPTGHVVRVIAGHQVKRINVTINVPRNYFVGIFKARNPGVDAPDDAALQPILTEQLAMITDKIQPLITKGQEKGQVRASMYFDEQYLAPVTAGGGGGIPESIRPWAWNAGAAGLAIAALAFAVYFARRTTQEEDLPTVEELAGIPETLPADEDLLGEAEEVEDTLAGVELDESQLQARKVAEQISEMIKSSPEEAGSLLGKWVAVDD